MEGYRRSIFEDGGNFPKRNLSFEFFEHFRVSSESKVYTSINFKRGLDGCRKTEEEENNSKIESKLFYQSDFFNDPVT